MKLQFFLVFQSERVRRYQVNLNLKRLKDTGRRRGMKGFPLLLSLEVFRANACSGQEPAIDQSLSQYL